MNRDLEDTLRLLLEHRWLYQFPVTKILVKDLLTEFPSGWIEALKNLTLEELNELVVGEFIDERWPSTLINFVVKCREIRTKLSRNCISEMNDSEELPRNLTLGLNPKKQHEALRLARFTHEMCSKVGLDVVVDLGAGLGYVCQILHHLFNYKVLGLEADPRITETANQRQSTLYPSSKASVKYFCLKVSGDSGEDIENLVNLMISGGKEFCLIGLHSCGELSVNALKLFKNIKRAKLLVMMSCCYHKIEFCHDKKIFKNFPMSNGLEEIYLEARHEFGDAEDILGRPFLRLACQEPSERWRNSTKEDHERHSLCLMARAVVELFCEKNDIVLTKTKRKSARTSQCRDFTSYFQNFIDRYEFNGENFDKKRFDEIEKIWNDNEKNLLISEIYTGLQLLLQAPAEYLVLNDRRSWLTENGFINTRIISVLDKKLSPRSHAIVSSKS